MKKITKTLCGVVGSVLGLSFLVAGCATVPSIKNTDSELIYNGNAAVMVDGYLYYGNAFADYSTFTSDGDYNKSVAVSYLSRLNTNIDLAAKSKDYSPKSVEKVADEITAQGKSFTFVLGDHVYYLTPNRQKFSDENGKASHYFNYSTIYRSNLNGDNKEKVYTTNGEVSQIEALKFNGRYYIILLAGENLVKIEIGNKVSAETISDSAKSVAIPKTFQKKKDGSTLNWNGDIYFTEEKSDEDNGLSGSIVKKVSVAGGETKQIFHKNGATLKFVGRERDELFYSLSNEIYKIDSNSITGQPNFASENNRFYSASTISNLNLIATENYEYGYVFTTSSNALVYATKTGKFGSITLKNGDTSLSSYKILLISGRTIYVSTTTGIYKATLSGIFSGNGGNVEIECETIVEMTAIYDGTLCAFDKDYIYYYAKLESVEKDEDEKEETTEETDDNYYLYRARVGVTSADGYELLGLTKIASRHTK